MLYTHMYTHIYDWFQFSNRNTTISIISQYKSYKYDHKCHILRKLFLVTQTQYIIRTAWNYQDWEVTRYLVTPLPLQLLPFSKRICNDVYLLITVIVTWLHFLVTVTSIIVTFIVIFYTYNTYVWNRHKQVLKERSVMFDHVSINRNIDFVLNRSISNIDNCMLL